MPLNASTSTVATSFAYEMPATAESGEAVCIFRDGLRKAAIDQRDSQASMDCIVT